MPFHVRGSGCERNIIEITNRKDDFEFGLRRSIARSVGYKIISVRHTLRDLLTIVATGMVSKDLSINMTESYVVQLT